MFGNAMFTLSNKKEGLVLTLKMQFPYVQGVIYPWLHAPGGENQYCLNAEIFRHCLFEKASGNWSIQTHMEPKHNKTKDIYVFLGDMYSGINFMPLCLFFAHLRSTPCQVETWHGRGQQDA